MIFQIMAPHFVAGFIMQDDRVIKAAPIIRWTLYRHLGEIKAYCVRKGWEIREVCPNQS